MSRRFYWVRAAGSSNWVPAARDEYGSWYLPGSDMVLRKDDFAQIGEELIPPTTSMHRVLGKVRPGEVHHTMDGQQVLIVDDVSQDEDDPAAREAVEKWFNDPVLAEGVQKKVDEAHGREVEDNVIHGLKAWVADR